MSIVTFSGACTTPVIAQESGRQSTFQVSGVSTGSDSVEVSGLLDIDHWEDPKLIMGSE